MKRSCLVLVALVLSGCSGGLLDPLDPDAFRQYSGTVTIETGGKKSVLDYYRDGKKLRIVPRVAAGSPYDQRVAIIVDEAAKTATAVSMGRKQYYVHPLRAQDAPGANWPLGQFVQGSHNLTRQDLGTETIDGHPCTVQRVVMQAADGSQQAVKVWSARDLRGFAIKVEATAGGTPLVVTFADVKLGPTGDPSLFVVPADFTKAG
jgi:hypothetical protein